tara:strand:+ start:276 stop:842 length:567 start_codon:yes stop_codon:yes gene_type:complete
MNDEVWSAIEADASAFDNLTTEAGSELSDLIRKCSELDKVVNSAEEDLKRLKKERDSYLYDFIPAKMQEVGMDKVEVDGNTISLKTYVNATLPKDPLQKDVAFAHLRDIGCEDFIKNEVKVSFGLKEDNMAKSIQADLEEKGLETTARTWVEPMTLKKLVKERMENNQEIDLEIFNAHIGTVAKIKGA